MPPSPKFTKEHLINTACLIVQKEGIENLNARRLAKELNASVGPIFHNFTSMTELKHAVYDKIQETYRSYMKVDPSSPKPYKTMGLSYIKFASTFPEYFKLIFMQQTHLNAETFVMADKVGEDVINQGMKMTHLSYEEQKKFHIKVWIFTHGIACLVATKTVTFTDEEIDQLLSNTVTEMLTGYLKNKKEEETK